MSCPLHGNVWCTCNYRPRGVSKEESQALADEIFGKGYVAFENDSSEPGFTTTIDAALSANAKNYGEILRLRAVTVERNGEIKDLTAERDRLRAENAELRAKFTVDWEKWNKACSDEEIDALTAERDRLRAELAIWRQRVDREQELTEEFRTERDRLRDALESANAVVAFVRRMGHGHAGELARLIDAFHARAALAGGTDAASDNGGGA